MKQKAALVDIHRCVGCEMCKWACKTVNNLPDTDDQKLSASAFKVVKEREGRYTPRQCMHCKDAACKSVCPTGAFKKDENGAVYYEGWRCMGCRYCQLACPFEIPRYEWHKRLPYVTKCDFCQPRMAEGKIPACVEECPFEAMAFGDYDDILKMARKRIEENPGVYVDYIYGEKEVGGTRFLYLSDVPFEKLGFKMDLPKVPLPDKTWAVLKKVPDVVLFGGVTLYGIYWITSRREEVAKYEEKEKLKK